MASIDSGNFSASDLSLFIESMEKIAYMERLKRERQQQYRAQYLAETLRYLDQQCSAGNSSTLSSTDDPEEESEYFEDKEIVYHYADKDDIYHSTYEDQQNEYYHIGEDNEGTQNTSSSNTIYSMPLDCLDSTAISSSSIDGLYEHISKVKSKSTASISSDSYIEPLNSINNTKAPSTSNGIYEEISSENTKSSATISEGPVEVVKKRSLKRCFLGLVRRNYRKHFSGKTNNWSKSNSWLELTAL